MKRFAWITALLLTAMPAWTYENIRINDDDSGELQNEQQILVNPTDPDNVVAVWRDFRLGYRRVGLGTSFDGGVTWTQQLLEDAHYPWHSDPGLTVDRHGNFTVVFLSYVDTSSPNGLFVQRSTDGGLSWGSSVTVVDLVPGVFEDKELIACDRSGGLHDGNLYVAWARFGSMDNECRLARSTDAGASFQPSELLESDGLQWPVPAVGPGGELYVAWLNYSYGLRLKRSDDGGESFGTRRTIDQTANAVSEINGGILVFSYPALDVDRSDGPHQGRLHVAYMASSSTSGMEIFYRFSDDGGQNWQPRQRLNDDPEHQGTDQFHPWLAVSEETGELAVMFYDRRNDPGNYLMDVYWTRSTDGGSNWTPNERVTTVSSDPGAGSRAGLIGEYNGLAWAPNGWNIVWTDTRDGDQDTYTAPIRTPLPTVTPTPEATPPPGTPEPTTTPVAGLGVRLELRPHVSPGEPFAVTGFLDNPGPPLANIPVVFALQVGPEFWFWPSWAHYAPPAHNEVDWQVRLVPTGTDRIEVIPVFTWPGTGSQSAEGLWFHGAMLDETAAAILGSMASVEWGYGP